MSTPRSLLPGEEATFKVALRSKGWFPITARFTTKCRKCGVEIKPGEYVAWHKGRSEIMHFNPCSISWMEENTHSQAEAEKAPTLGGVFGKRNDPNEPQPPTPAPAVKKTEVPNAQAPRKPYFLGGKLNK